MYSVERLKKLASGEIGGEIPAIEYSLAADEIVALRECLERARQICSNAHDMVLRGADDSELCDMLEDGYGLTPNAQGKPTAANELTEG